MPCTFNTRRRQSGTGGRSLDETGLITNQPTITTNKKQNLSKFQKDANLVPLKQSLKNICHQVWPTPVWFLMHAWRKTNNYCKFSDLPHKHNIHIKRTKCCLKKDVRIYTGLGPSTSYHKGRSGWQGLIPEETFSSTGSHWLWCLSFFLGTVPPPHSCKQL